MSDKIFVTQAELAALLGLKGDRAFETRRKRLERDEGFPRPTCIQKKPLLWRLQPVLDWIKHHDVPVGPQPVALFQHREFSPELLPQVRMIERKAHTA